MNTHGYGRQAGVSARAGLVIALALLIATLVLSSMGYEDAMARVAGQGTWCERTGRRYNVHGQVVCEPQVSDDGMETWERLNRERGDQ